MIPMGDLTANLSRSEFACPCSRPECNRTPVDFELVTAIQAMADYLMDESDWLQVERVAVHINSGYRCRAYDREMKLKHGLDFNQKKLSEHVWGIAADHWFEFVEPDGNRVRIDDDIIADRYESLYIGRAGIGRYQGRTHLDFRSGPSARWDNR